MDTIQRPKASHIPGSRFAMAITSWIFAGIGVLSSIMFAGVSMVSENASGILAIMPLLAWVSLSVMTFLWIQDRHAHWLWPVIGLITGTISAVMFSFVFFVYISAVPLATYLVFWHLRDNKRSTDVT